LKEWAGAEPHFEATGESRCSTTKAAIEKVSHDSQKTIVIIEKMYQK
jgi:hypothetical protein